MDVNKNTWLYLGFAFFIIVTINLKILVIIFGGFLSIGCAFVACLNFNKRFISEQADILINGTARFLVDSSPLKLRKAAEQTIDHVQQADRKILLDRILEMKNSMNDDQDLMRLSANKQACLSYKVGESTIRIHESTKDTTRASYEPLPSSSRRNHLEEKCDKSAITGDTIIDAQLNDLLALVFRDYILTWYRLISENDNEFIHDLYDIIKYFIRSLSQRLKSIDTVGFITTKLVDDFASHLRLYRLAKSKLDAETRPPVGSPPEELAKYNEKLYDYFFDHECQMEKTICRDHVCQVPGGFNDYINHICDILQYLLLPIDCFMNRPLRALNRSILTNVILKPLLDLISEPDYINRMIVWLCKSYSGSSDIFILVLRNSESEAELRAVLSMVKSEIVVQRGKDTGGQDDHDIKQKLNSLLYVQSLLEQKIVASSTSPHHNVRKLAASQLKLYNEQVSGGSNSSGSSRDLDLVPQLSLTSIMMDNIALSHFIEFMSSIDAQNLTYFYLNVEGFKISVEHQLEGAQLGSRRAISNLEALREAASDIHRNYLDTKGRANFKIDIKDQDMIDRLAKRIKTAPVNQHWFHQVQQYVFHMMRDDARYYKAFCKSTHYTYLLNDLGLVRAPPVIQNDGNNNRSLTKSYSSTSISARLFPSSSFDGSPASNEYSCNSKVTAALDTDTEDNIALRVLLLLMDEVFELKTKAVWLRRQIMSFLRTLLHVTLGDKMNRKIVEYVEELTKPSAIAGYLNILKQSFWPGGRQATNRPKRDQDMKYRTQVAAKYLILCSLPDELKRIIGAETTRQGLMLVYETFQHETLNRRLVLVLIESLLNELFPTGHLDQVFQRLHKGSLRSSRHQRRASINDTAKVKESATKIAGHRRSASSTSHLKNYYCTTASGGQTDSLLSDWPPGLASLGQFNLLDGQN